MLYVLSDGTIRLTRGDTANFTVPITNKVPGQADTPYVIQTTDVIEFSVKKTTKDTESLIHKSVTGTNAFKIVPSDTEDLQFGKYVYDVQLTTGTDVYTVVEPATFEVMKEVT